MQRPLILRRYRQEQFAEARLRHPVPRIRQRALRLYLAAYHDGDRIACSEIETYREAAGDWPKLAKAAS